MSAGFAACRTDSLASAPRRGESLDLLLAAHADVLPEIAGAGANHDPMAAEVLEALGAEEQIPAQWCARARNYAGELPRVAPLAAEQLPVALGRSDRYGDWLDHFRAEIAARPWNLVVADWAPRLAPGLIGAAFHGLLRTAHAVRALRRIDSAERRNELAAGLASGRRATSSWRSHRGFAAHARGRARRWSISTIRGGTIRPTSASRR